MRFARRRAKKAGRSRNLPQPALAAVVITASLSLADIPATTRLWRQRKAEFLLPIAAFGGVALLGVLPGIAIALALSILNVFRRDWWPYDTELGRVEGLEGYHGTRQFAEPQGIALVFAEMKDPVRQKIERYGLARKIEARHFFPTIGAAVAHSATKPAPNGRPRAARRRPDGPRPDSRRYR
jgi:MFS superfamily sulfate permease-like transporter